MQSSLPGSLIQQMTFSNTLVYIVVYQSFLIFMHISDAIYDALPENAIWINVGPLTWHFEDIAGEMSIELPYSDIMLRIRQKGFEVVSEKEIDSKYTVNRLSMLQNQFNCAYFYARKVGQKPQ